MESSMSNYPEVISELIQLALKIKSNELLDIESKLIKVDNLRGNYPDEFYRELENQHPYIGESKFRHINITEISGSQWGDLAKLVAWAVNQLENWTDYKEDDQLKFMLLFNVTSFLDEDGYFWEFLSMSGILVSEGLIKRLMKDLRKIESKITFPDDISIPIHEKESINQLMSAIEDKQWKVISTLWNMFNRRPLLSVNSVQAIILLESFKKTALLNVFDVSNDIPIIMHTMYSVKRETSLFLASQTQNDYLEFCAVYSLMSNRSSTGALNDNENKYLTSIFNKVGLDNKKFTYWMNVFNQYPVRYPIIQVALGRMLAKSTPHNFKAYLSSIASIGGSKPSDECRILTTECLKNFVTIASPEKRKEFWGIAHQAWMEWDFGEEGKHLFEVNFSVFDFGIVGYYKECQTLEERDKLKQIILKNLQSLENHWHKSATDVSTYWYKNLSRYQVLKHADRANEDYCTWLLTDYYYTPEEFYKNRYSEMQVC